MPAGQLITALRSVLYFDGTAATRPVLVMVGWLVGGLVVMVIAEATRRRARAGAVKSVAVRA